MDYQNKIIAVIASNFNLKNMFLYIPCYPSNMYENYEIPILFIDNIDLKYFNNYQSTKKYLEQIYNDSNEVIQTKPLYKVIEDDLVIGIITNSNQFVMLNKPEIYINDELENIIDKNHLIIDNIIQNKFNIDENRVLMINNIKLETNFYNNFRNTIFKLLSEYKNFKFKIKIQDIINNYGLIYFDKLKLIRQELEQLSEGNIIFAEYDLNILNNIKHISLCINNTDCDNDFCMINKETNTCNLIIPNVNLITNENNYDIYFTKLSDEFIRYNKTNSFLFDTSKITTYNNIKYNINSDEVILIESILNKELNINKYNIKNMLSNYNTFDTYNINNNNNNNNYKINTDYQNSNNLKLDNIQTNDKITLKLPKSQIEKIKQIQEQYPKTETYSPEITQSKESIDIDEYINQNFKDCRFDKKKLVEGFKESFNDKTINNELYEINIKLENDNKTCYFQFILIILKNYYQNYLNSDKMDNIDIENLKNILIQEYFDNEFTEILLKLTNRYNKTLIMPLLSKLKNLKLKRFEKVNEFKEELSNIIKNPNYLFSYIDLYLICNKFKLPIILICNHPINPLINDSKNYIIMYKNNTDNNYYIVKHPNLLYLRRGDKNLKLLYLSRNLSDYNKFTIDIQNNMNNQDDNELRFNILSDIDNYEDKILLYLKKYQ